MKIAMIRVPLALKKAGLKGHLLLQEHDELVLECPDQEVKETIKIVQHVMETAYEIGIPLETEARVGVNWGDLQPI